MKVKRFLIDALALNIFVAFTAFFVEVIFSGIESAIFWKGRLIMILPNIITVEPYDVTRIWIGKQLGIWKSSELQRIVRDTIVFVLYRVPLIFIVLTFLGASQSQVVSACIAATLISGFTGRPYGIFLDWSRKLSGIR
jgi:hypothetical protein